MKLSKVLAATAAIGCLAAFGAAAPAQAKPSEMIVYGGPLNTSWYLLSGFIATTLQKEGVRATSELGGSVSNLIQIGSDPGKMGLVFAANYDDGRQGVAPFPQPVTNFCGIQSWQNSSADFVDRWPTRISAVSL